MHESGYSASGGPRECASICHSGAEIVLQFAKCHSEKPKAPKNLCFLYGLTAYATPEILRFAQDDRHFFNCETVSKSGVTLAASCAE